MKTKVLTIFATILFCFSLMGNLSADNEIVYKKLDGLNGVVVTAIVDNAEGVVVTAIVDNILINSSIDGNMVIEATKDNRVIFQDISNNSDYSIDTEGWAKGQYELKITTSTGTNYYTLTKS